MKGVEEELKLIHADLKEFANINHQLVNNQLDILRAQNMALSSDLEANRKALSSGLEALSSDLEANRKALSSDLEALSSDLEANRKALSSDLEANRKATKLCGAVGLAGVVLACVALADRRRP